MDTMSIREFLKTHCEDIEHSRDKKLSLSSILARGIWDGVPTVGIGGDRSIEEQIHSVVDALHWYRAQYLGLPVLRLVLGKATHTHGLLEALAILIAARRPGSMPPLEVMLDGKSTILPACPTFEIARVEDWMASIKDRLSKKEPSLVAALSDDIGDVPSFRWYRGVKAAYWSGRVEGLEVCRIDPKSETGHLEVGREGKEGKRSKAAEEAMRLLEGAPPDFSESDVKSVAAAIRRVAEARQKDALIRDYQPEHRFEARVLRAAVRIPAGNRPGAGLLRPVFENRPFQFPTLWHTEEGARYIDIIMYENNVPWVVELKYAKSCAGQYYRHAIGQAVLYREFIRRAPAVREFLKNEMRLDATGCKAIVAFPNPAPKYQHQLDVLRELAADFDVEIVTLKDVL